MLLLLYILCFGRHRAPMWLMGTLLCIEIVVINIGIALNGAATNPFSSLLLAPLVLGLILLPVKSGLIIVAISVLAQSVQLYFAPPAEHHSGMMAEHARGMIASFIATSLLITVVVLYFKLKLNVKSQAIHQLRERQLRDEQLLAIGTAAAQLTHDAATPVQTLRLVFEEVLEAQRSPLIKELEPPLEHLETLLKDWRQVADDIREARLTTYSAQQLVASAKSILRLSRPEANIAWSVTLDSSNTMINADRTLVPALASIIINACDAAGEQQICVALHARHQEWVITVTNPYSAKSALPPNSLGNRIVESETGFGVGAVLSNATVEKFGGKVTWTTTALDVVTTIVLKSEAA